ncbi:VOC family protein [Humibacter albus]|jgi:catechol 2,3-dioxygenase-like lactoylglutathione lyase family enzyme|uniref:VOC family protein n=1 Tax=Humibacter albus TaxID=427754 RepID=UPI0003B538EB|nr:VOC family protein [Humibacter albus]
MAVTSILLLSVPVSDPDRARDFYVDTLGFTLVSDTMMDGDQRWMQVVPPGADTSITLVTWFDTMPPGSLRGLVLETDDLEDDVHRLTKAGVAFDSGIERAPWGQYAQFSDPDGNGLILQQTAGRGAPAQ